MDEILTIIEVRLDEMNKRLGYVAEALENLANKGCARCKGTGTQPGERGEPVYCEGCNGRGY